MAEVVMKRNLADLQIKDVSKNFLEEKITPDIVRKLTESELFHLGITSRHNMMKLHIECYKYGGRFLLNLKNIYIPKFVIENLIDEDFTISKVQC